MRLHQAAKPPRSDMIELRADFWSAPPEALFDRKTVAAGLCRSVGWLELLATNGAGPAFLKAGTHRVLYRKSDVLAWFEQYARRITSTSELSRPSRSSSEGPAR